MLPSTLKTEPERSGDPLFGLLVGCYLALLATAPVVYAAVELGVRDGGALYGTVLVTLTVVAGSGWWAAGRLDGLAARLGATRFRWALGLLGVVYAFAGLYSLEVTGVAGVLGMFFGMGAMSVGGALGVMARTRYTDTVLADSERSCEFRAGWPAAARRRLLLLAIPFWLAGAVGFVSVYVVPDSWPLTFVQLLFPVGIAVFVQSEPREYAITAEGIEQRLPVARRLLPWTRYTGYSRTEDALVVHRPRWFDGRFALADLEDPDAVEAALASHLPAA
jgi:hypothetical protein